jgi:shikimate dehydrogenase
MREINGKTETLGVIGNPIEHTLSPVIHNTLCELLGINAVYVPIHVEQDIDTAIKGLYASGIKRLNVTVPYKKDVMNSLVEIDELAEEIGAVNTLVPFAGGFKGYNTDMPGLKRALESKGVKLEGKKAILIGAGGAARAVCLMLIKSGVSSKLFLFDFLFTILIGLNTPETF